MTFIYPNLPSIADKTISIDGFNIAYKDQGTGSIILCLHAIGHSSKDFAAVHKMDTSQYRIISLDFPGHGNSPKNGYNISASNYASIVVKCIEKLGLKDIIIVGNSIGGAVALRVASNNPNVRMLALSNPAGLDKRGVIAPFFLNYMIKFFQEGAHNSPNFTHQFEKYYRKVLITEVSEQRRKEIINDCFTLAPLLVQAWASFKSKEEDLRSLIPTIHCPILFTWAMRDKFVRFTRNRAAIQKFNNYKLIQYQIGHTPYIECPDMFLLDFTQFIEENK